MTHPDPDAGDVLQPDRPDRLPIVFRDETPCPECNAGEDMSVVYKSVRTDTGRNRYRRCLICGEKFIEQVESRS